MSEQEKELSEWEKALNTSRNLIARLGVDEPSDPAATACLSVARAMLQIAVERSKPDAVKFFAASSISSEVLLDRLGEALEVVEGKLTLQEKQKQLLGILQQALHAGEEEEPVAPFFMAFVTAQHGYLTRARVLGPKPYAWVRHKPDLMRAKKLFVSIRRAKTDLAAWDAVNEFFTYYGIGAKTPTPDERKAWTQAKRNKYRHPLAKLGVDIRSPPKSRPEEPPQRTEPGDAANETLARVNRIL